MCSLFRSLFCPSARTHGFCRIAAKLVNLTVRVRNLNTPSFSVETKWAIRSLPHHVIHLCLSFLHCLVRSGLLTNWWALEQLQQAGAKESMGGLQPLPLAALPSTWIKEAVTGLQPLSLSSGFLTDWIKKISPAPLFCLSRISCGSWFSATV